jgi:hypothetical protein
MTADDTYRLLLGSIAMLFFLFCVVVWAERGNYHKRK